MNLHNSNLCALCIHALWRGGRDASHEDAPDDAGVSGGVAAISVKAEKEDDESDAPVMHASDGYSGTAGDIGSYGADDYSHGSDTDA